ncbi:MAG: hypothetical protein FWH47_06285 [Methanomassiliicoccaceae archaeon]|nr:hypothetical protein [Methanomassiliicoccaceae archaeon]
MEYDYTTTVAGVKDFEGTLEITIVGQNAKEYFSMVKQSNSTIEVTFYLMDSKESPPGAVKTGTEEMDTFEGMKTLEIWEYTDADTGTAVKLYADPENGMSYKVEETRGTDYGLRILKSYDLKWQGSYKESKAIGTTYEYAYTFGTISVPVEMRCVADCLGGQYGVVYDFSSFIPADNLVYYLSDNVQGLPADAVNTTYTYPLDTIDGPVTVEIWSIVDGYGYGFLFLYDPESKIVYEIDILTVSGDMDFILTKKP